MRARWVRDGRPFSGLTNVFEPISRQNKDLFAEENSNQVSPEADEVQTKKWSFLVDILRAGLEPRLNARSFPLMLVTCLPDIRLFYFLRPLKSKLQFSTRPANVLRRARNTKNIKSFQKSAFDAHAISRARVTAKAQVRNLPVANLGPVVLMDVVKGLIPRSFVVDSSGELRGRTARIGRAHGVRRLAQMSSSSH
jgi:hypothetical protein